MSAGFASSSLPGLGDQVAQQIIASAQAPFWEPICRYCRISTGSASGVRTLVADRSYILWPALGKRPSGQHLVTRAADRSGQQRESAPMCVVENIANNQPYCAVECLILPLDRPSHPGNPTTSSAARTEGKPRQG